MRRYLVSAIFHIFGLSLVLGACGEKEQSAEQECVRATKNLAKLSKSDMRRAKHVKVEYNTNMKECMSSWSKERASCVADADTQNQMIRCRGFRSRQWSENFRKKDKAP